MTGPAPRVNVPADIDGEAVRAKLRDLLAQRDRIARARKKLADMEQAERDTCRDLAASVHSLSGFYVDGQLAQIHRTPGKPPIIHTRPVPAL